MDNRTKYAMKILIPVDKRQDNETKTQTCLPITGKDVAAGGRLFSKIISKIKNAMKVLMPRRKGNGVSETSLVCSPTSLSIY
jgi:hypothetical protein